MKLKLPDLKKRRPEATLEATEHSQPPSVPIPDHQAEDPLEHKQAPQPPQGPAMNPALKKALPFMLMGSAAALAGGYLMFNTPAQPEETATVQTTSTAETAGTLASPDIASAPQTQENIQTSASAATTSEATTASGIAANPNTKRVRNPFVPEKDTDAKTAASALAQSSAPTGSPPKVTGKPPAGLSYGAPSATFDEEPAVFSSLPTVTAPEAPASRPNTSKPSTSRSSSSAVQAGKPVTWSSVEDAPTPPPITWGAPVTTLPVQPTAEAVSPRPVEVVPRRAAQPQTTPPQATQSPVTAVLLPAETPEIPDQAASTDGTSAAPQDTQPVAANQAEAFVAEHGISLAAQAQDEDSKTLMLESRYGPVYVESGATIPGTKATVTVQDKQTVKITVGQDSTTLKLGS